MDEDHIFHEYGSPDVRDVMDGYLRLHGGIAKHIYEVTALSTPVRTRRLTGASLASPGVSRPFHLIADPY